MYFLLFCFKSALNVFQLILHFNYFIFNAKITIWCFVLLFLFKGFSFSHFSFINPLNIFIIFDLMHFSVNFSIWVILNWISIVNLCFLEYRLTFSYFLCIPNFVCVFCLFACFNSILDIKALNSVMFLWRRSSVSEKKLTCLQLNSKLSLLIL